MELTRDIEKIIVIQHKNDVTFFDFFTTLIS